MIHHIDIVSVVLDDDGREVERHSMTANLLTGSAGEKWMMDFVAGAVDRILLPGQRHTKPKQRTQRGDVVDYRDYNGK
jgi:hypothetical protein